MAEILNFPGVFKSRSRVTNNQISSGPQDLLHPFRMTFLGPFHVGGCWECDEIHFLPWAEVPLPPKSGVLLSDVPFHRDL